MQNKKMVQEKEHERNEVSYPENVHAKGGTTSRSPYIVIMNYKMMRHHPTKGEASTYRLRTKE